LNVSGIAGEKGIFNNTIQTTQTVTSLITNTSVGPLTSIPVTLTVTGANPYTITQTIATIGAGATETLLFANVPATNFGSQTITVSIPVDDDPANNSQIFEQQVQCDTIGYVQTPVQSGGVGFNTGAGLIGVMHTVPATLPTFVKSVSNYFPISADNAGNTIKGILLSSTGVILDSTNLITITAAMLGTKQDFDFINGAVDVSGGVMYVGFRQTANAVTGYFPFANQANSYIDPNAGATFPVFGGVPSPLGSGLGYMMIEATLTFDGFDVANTSTNGQVCLNSTLGILPTTGFSNYEFFVDASSVQNGAIDTYTAGPIGATTTFSVDVTNGTCVFSSNLQTITIATALVNNFAAGICPGQSYTFGSQTLTTAGSYADTIPSVAGCDSIINLTLSNLVPTLSTLSADICQGDTYQFESQMLTAAGTYTETIPNAAGCDSVITLTLAVNAPSTSTSSLTVCATSYQFGAQNLTASGTFTRTIPNAANCDSVITLNLTLNPPISATAVATGVSIAATTVPAATSYQWIDCGTNAPVVGATSATFDPIVNGSYAVVVENAAGCSDTSNCADVTTIGLDEMLLNASIRVYPNPAVSEIHAVSNGSQILSYSVLDANGRVVLGQKIQENTTEIQISLDSISEGTYILEMKTSEGKVFKPFVKK
jgi:hypothetical protein